MPQINFDPKSVAPMYDTTIKPVPVGRYVVRIDETKLALSKTGESTNLTITLRIDAGEHKGRYVTDILVVASDNPDKQKGVQMGQSKLSAYCHCVGLDMLNTTEELVGKQLDVDLTIEIDPSGKYGDKNRVKTYYKCTNHLGQPPHRPSAMADDIPF